MVTFRLATPEDAVDMLAIYRPLIEDSAISFEYDPPSAEEFGKRIQSTLQRFPWLACQWDQQVIGYAYGGPHRSRQAYQWSVEFSVYVHSDFRRKGIALGLYQSLQEILELQGYRNALAGITLPNPASVAFHESFGFTPVGVYHQVGYKQGSWLSVGWWEKRIGDDSVEPTPPQTIGQVTQNLEFQQCLSKGLEQVKIIE